MVPYCNSYFNGTFSMSNWHCYSSLLYILLPGELVFLITVEYCHESTNCCKKVEIYSVEHQLSNKI